MMNQTKLTTTLGLSLWMVLAVSSQSICVSAAEKADQLLIRGREKSDRSNQSDKAKKIEMIYQSRDRGSMDIDNRERSRNSIENLDMKGYSDSRREEVQRVRESQMQMGTGSSGGGDKYVTDFVKIARERIHPWLVDNQDELAQQEIQIDPQKFYDAINPQQIASKEHVFESCDNSDSGPEREACYNDNKRDRNNPALYHVTFINRSMYQLTSVLSCQKASFVLHEVLRRMGVSLNRYQDAVLMPLHCRLDQLDFDKQPKTAIEIPNGTMITLDKSVMVPEHSGFDLSQQFLLGPNKKDEQWNKSCWVNLDRAVPTGGVLKPRQMIVLYKAARSFRPHNQVVFGVKDLSADESELEQERGLRPQEFLPRVKEVVCEVTTNLKARFSPPSPLVQTTYSEIQNTLSMSGFSMILNPLPEK